VLIRDLATRKVVKQRDTQRWIDEIIWHRDGRSMILNSSSKILQWNLDTNEEQLHSGDVTAVAVSPATGDIHVAQSDGPIEIWKSDFSSMTKTVSGHITGPPKVLAFSKDGAWRASGGDDNVVRVVKQDAGRVLSRSLLWPYRPGSIIGVQPGRRHVGERQLRRHS
jgi:WD40 repeat protein